MKIYMKVHINSIQLQAHKHPILWHWNV